MLLDKIIGNIRGIFWVPRYQRGYRWTAEDVQRLLDDIWNCNGNDCCLQPIVVKLHQESENENDCEWELIDGQQRLTTLFLIMQYMRRKGWDQIGAPYRIIYDTRDESEGYLGNPDPETSNKNIDFYHIYQADTRISEWFNGHGDAIQQNRVARRIFDYLYDNVRVIWYVAPPQDDSALLFTRLNVGRIPLTNAELIKAQLLSSVQEDRKHELAAQWDSIERELHHPEIWAFVTGLDDSKNAEQFPTRISLLLDTLADKRNRPEGKRPTYHTFDMLCEEIKTDPVALWDEVIDLHALILGWYDDYNLYNKIGFLVSSHILFGRLVDLAENKKKSDFSALLVEEIQKTINKCPSDLLKLSYDKRDDYHKLTQLLLLMNVETVSKAGQRFPFNRHIGKTWTLEHIHAQNAEKLTKVEEWKTWLGFHKQALNGLPDNDKPIKLIQEIDEALQGADTARNFGATFENLSVRIFKELSSDDSEDHKLHSISNIALLASGDNSALSNSAFEVKRQKVLEIDRNIDNAHNGYIPICTRNVFLKYYTMHNAQQMYYWSFQDRECYFQAILTALQHYLKPETKIEEEAQ